MQVASRFNPKARAFVNGRKDLFDKMTSSLASNRDPLVWFHCASVGEFEQARPIMEAFKTNWPDHKILLTFFSPSGYELRKNYSGADYIFYLPWDTSKNAKRFIEITKPQLAIFIKYEFWLNFTMALKAKNIPIVSVSSIFRPNQAFFKFYGGLFRKILKNFTYFFVQNTASANLLKQIGIQSVTVAGDTRFDRVYQIIKQGADIPMATKFKAGQKLFVVGSCWPEDLNVLAPFINENRNQLKFIIAPHELSESFLKEIENSLQVTSIRYSQANENVGDASVLIIDNIGMLSKLYRYGEFAYIGGAFGKGLHNILEAACYGIPIFFGNRNYQKFQEANDLIMRGGAFEVNDYSELKSKYEMMMNRPENFLLACEVTKSYVEENLGATQKIIKHCSSYLQRA
jgi:3-deoxy-D-manno-octulosonic-acid transferase